MPFPATRERGDDRPLFVVQDPRLRSMVLPLFSFDPARTDDRPLGHGTAFRIDPWGSCATAFHVIEDLLTLQGDQPVLRDDIRLAALEIEEFGYGLASLPPNCWRAFTAMSAVCGVETPPIGAKRLRNLTELAWLDVKRSALRPGSTPFLPMDMRRWRPAPGKRVQALGFADLDVDERAKGDARPLSQHLYGSEAEIVDVQPPNPDSGRPWPLFRVEADWPGGMSGGPVFNDDGHVIGLVSTGVAGAGIGAATCFAGWNAAEGTFRSLDASNPGSLLCWAALDQNDDIIALAPARDLLQPTIAEGKATYLAFVSVNPSTGGYLRIDNRRT